MVWTLFRQQQQCGAQMPPRSKAPAVAVAGREAQDHEQAGETLQAGAYPASALANRDQDITPSALDPRVEWDDVVQPERRQRPGANADDLPLPEGK